MTKRKKGLIRILFLQTPLLLISGLVSLFSRGKIELIHPVGLAILYATLTAIAKLGDFEWDK